MPWGCCLKLWPPRFALLGKNLFLKPEANRQEWDQGTGEAATEGTAEDKTHLLVFNSHLVMTGPTFLNFGVIYCPLQWPSPFKIG